MTPRRSLILPGGGMRVIWQAGVLRALAEEGIAFAHADATSTGALNLAMILSGLSPEQICERWRTLRIDDLRGPSLPPDGLRSQAIALGDSRELREKLIPRLGIDTGRLRAQGPLRGTFNVFNFNEKTSVAIPNTAMDLDLLVAAMSLPVLYPPVEHNGVTYTDSAWVRNANLIDAVRGGAEELWVVWCTGNTPTYQPGLFRQFVHMLEMAANGSLFDDFDRIAEWNGRIEAGEWMFGQRQPVRLHVITPERPLPLDPERFFSPADAGALIAQGYEAAKHYLRTRGEHGMPFTPAATRMREPAAGVGFRERLIGDVGGAQLSVTSTVIVEDLDAFLDDPFVGSAATATLDYPPLGTGLPSVTGKFNLITSPEETVIEYDLEFEVHGQAYTLAITKRYTNESTVDLWRDVTTATAQLHQGPDQRAKVIASGHLRLSLADMTRMVGSLRAQGAANPAQGAQAVARFGRVLIGGLWERYGRASAASA